MTTPRVGAGMTLLPGGKVLVAGGSNGSIDHEKSAEIFTPSPDLNSGTWAATSSMSASRYAFGMGKLKGGKVLAAAADPPDPNDPSAPIPPASEIFDPTSGTSGTSGTWSPVVPAPGNQDMERPFRTFFESIPLADGRMIVAGGIGPDPDNDVLAEADLYDTDHHRWLSAQTMSLARHHSASTELLDGRVLVAGGFTKNTFGIEEITDSAETYLPCPPNLAPVAACIPNQTAFATANSCSLTVGNINNNSYDPDNQPGPFSVSQVAAAGTVVTGSGTTTVTLTANDGELSSQCTTKYTMVDNIPPQITCRDDDPAVAGNQVYLECVNGGASGVGVFTASATDSCDGTLTPTCTPTGAPWLPLGATASSTCTVSDRAVPANPNSCNITAIVRDTQPPVTGGSKGMVLGNTGAQVEVSLMDCANFTVDACKGRMNPLKDFGVITKITSDEPETGQGDNTTGDMVIKKTWLSLLRAERRSNGDGRVYTIYYRTGDKPVLNGQPDGNIATGSCKVTVPKNGSAVEGPPVYCVGPDC